MNEEENAIADARCRVMWGDGAEQAHAILSAAGLDRRLSDQWVASFLAERHATIRAVGRRYITIGCCLVPLPVLYWVISLSIGVISLKIMGLAIVGAAYGVWKLVDGLINFLCPQKVAGSVTEMG